MSSSLKKDEKVEDSSSGSPSRLAGDLLTELTKHTILHAAMILAPRGSVKLPSGSHRIEQFCREVLNTLNSYKKTNAKKKKQPVATLPITDLIPEVEILNFYEGVSSYEEFTAIVCHSIIAIMEEEFDQSKIQALCWEYYSEYYKAEIAYPKWFSGKDLFNLWLIFCSHLSTLSTLLDPDILNDILRMFVARAGFTWNEAFQQGRHTTLDFIQFLSTLVECFSSLQVDSSVIAEIIVDMKDEVVNGVLRKGYLFKKGHQVKNWKRRFFVLTRSSLTYFESREKMALKGSMAINENTHTEVLEEKGDKKHKFLVTCGSTGTEYIMCADDSRTRNEWLLDIAKAIQLEKALVHSTRDSEINSSIATFYQLKYGTTEPNLSRIDSTIRHATMSSSSRVNLRIKKISKDGMGGAGGMSSVDSNTDLNSPLQKGGEGEGGDSPSSVTRDGEDFYEEMSGVGGGIEEVDNSDDEDGAYTFMFHGTRGKEMTETTENTRDEKEKEILQSDSMKRAIQLTLSAKSLESSPVKEPVSPIKEPLPSVEEHKDSIDNASNDSQGESTSASSLINERDPRYYVNLEVSNNIGNEEAKETAVEDKTLEDSSDSHFESLWIQPQIPPHKSASRAASLPPSFINAVEEKKINPTELYLPVLPDRNPQQRAVPPPVSPRRSRASLEKVTPPTTPNRTELSTVPTSDDSELYYILPPAVPLHRTKGGYNLKEKVTH